MEYILCAANWYDDGVEHAHQPNNITSGFVICGRRHHNCIHTFAMMVGFPYDDKAIQLRNKEVQGFLTNTNKFIGRLKATKIAFKANQTLKSKGELFSEDLW